MSTRIGAGQSFESCPRRSARIAGDPSALDPAAKLLIIQECLQSSADFRCRAGAGHQALVDEWRQVVGQADDERRQTDRERVDRHGGIDRDQALGRAEQRRQRDRGGQNADVRHARGCRAVDVGRFRRVRLDREVHRRRVANRRDERRQRLPRLLLLSRKQHERLRGGGAGLAPRPRDVGRRQRAHGGDEFVEPCAAGHSDGVSGEAAGIAQMGRRMFIKDQRPCREGKAVIGGVANVGQRFVALVPVVQPMAVDEAMLQADQRHTDPTGFEGEGASPAAGLRVGHRHLGFDRRQCRRRFLHGTRRPWELQQRHAAQLLAHQRPAIDAMNHRVLPQAGAHQQAAADVVAAPVELLRSPQGWRRRVAFDRHHAALAVRCQRIPPAARPEVGARSDADVAHPAGGARFQLAQNRADIGLGAAAAACPPERTVHEGGDRRGAARRGREAQPRQPRHRRQAHGARLQPQRRGLSAGPTGSVDGDPTGRRRPRGDVRGPPGRHADCAGSIAGDQRLERADRADRQQHGLGLVQIEFGEPPQRVAAEHESAAKRLTVDEKAAHSLDPGVGVVVRALLVPAFQTGEEVHLAPRAGGPYVETHQRASPPRTSSIAASTAAVPTPARQSGAWPTHRAGGSRMRLHGLHGRSTRTIRSRGPRGA
jgi:hypothetical protein